MYKGGITVQFRPKPEYAPTLVWLGRAIPALVPLQCLGCAGKFKTSTVQYIDSSEHPQLKTSTAQDIHSLGRATPESPLLTALWHCQESATHTPWFYKNPWIVQVPGEASLRYQNVPVLECTRETLESNTFCPGAEGCGSTDDLEHSPFTVTAKGGINVLALCTVRPYSPEHRAHTDTTLLLMQS